MRIKVGKTEIIISDGQNKYHIRALISYIGIQSPRNEKVVAAAKALGGKWKPGAKMWALPWEKLDEIIETFTKIQVPGYTLTIDEEVAYQAGLID